MEKSTASRVLLTLFRILFTLFVLWTILFIFRNSLESGALLRPQPSGHRGGKPAPGPGGALPLSNALVRKLAHFENICCWASGTPCACGCTPAATSATSAGPCCWASWWPTWTRPCNVMWLLLQQSSGRVDRLRRLRLRVAAALCALVLIGGLLSLAGFGRKG